MGSNDDEDKNDLWTWSDKQLQYLKAEHKKFFDDLRDEGKRLEKEWPGSDTNDGNTITSSFSAFKKFVDNGLGSLTSAVRNFPSNVSELRSRMQDEIDRYQEEEQDISRRWTGSNDTPNDIITQSWKSSAGEKIEVHEATLSLLFEAWKRNEHVPLPKIQALYSDIEAQPLGYLDILGQDIADRANIGNVTRIWVPQRPRWLSVEWFKRSPYSPIRLEAHPDLATSGAKWRAAFEDLMSASLDKPMTSKEWVGERTPYGRPQSTYYGPGLEWMLSLQCRGVLPPLLPLYYNNTRISGYESHTGHHLLPQFLAPAPSRKQPIDLWCAGAHGFSKDLANLSLEVGTKATADSEADPLRHLAQPETEQDFYDSPYVFPPSSPARNVKEAQSDLLDQQMRLMQLDQQGMKRLVMAEQESDEQGKVLEDDEMQTLLRQHQNGREAQKRCDERKFEEDSYGRERFAERWRSDREIYDRRLYALGLSAQERERFEAEADLMDAMLDNDVAEATGILNEWHKRHGDMSELYRELVQDLRENSSTEPTSNWYTVLNEALRQSDLPDTDWNKRESYSRSTEMLERLDAEPLVDKRRRRQLIQHAENITGGPISFDRYLPLSELEEYVEGLEEELANLWRMAGNKTGRPEVIQDKHKTGAATTATIQRPDVLSALTTTQATRLPDGTVTTKVVLKQKFADGREKTTESVHTTHETVEQQQRKQQEAQDAEPKKKGWFWS